MTSASWPKPGWLSEMQAKNSALYLLSHAIPAVAAFLTLAAYTRWISAGDYGVYSTVLVMATSANSILFNWIYVGIMRYWSDSSMSNLSLHSAVLASLLVISGGVCLLALAYALFSGSYAIPLAFTALLVTGAFYSAYQRINSIKLEAQRYLQTEVLRVLVATSLGLGLVYMGYSWYGIVLATCLGFMLVPLFSAHFWRTFWQPHLRLERGVFNQLLRYGLPLGITFMLLEVIHASDRVLLSSLLGFEAAGHYAVAFSLPYQILIMLVSAINMAFYPMIMRTLGNGGEAAAQEQLKQYLLVLLGVVMPAWLGMVAVAEDFLPVLIGGEFLPQALDLLPMAGLAVTLSCIYMFHTSLAFQLGKKTVRTIWVVGLAAILNILLNYLLIPEYGLEGALAASILAYALCVCYGHWLGRSCYRLPVAGFEAMKVVLAAIVMLAVLKSLPLGHGVLEGGIRVVAGLFVYLALLFMLNVSVVREYSNKVYKQFQASA